MLAELRRRHSDSGRVFTEYNGAGEHLDATVLGVVIGNEATALLCLGVIDSFLDALHGGEGYAFKEGPPFTEGLGNESLTYFLAQKDAVFSPAFNRLVSGVNGQVFPAYCLAELCPVPIRLEDNEKKCFKVLC